MRRLSDTVSPSRTAGLAQGKGRPQETGLSAVLGLSHSPCALLCLLLTANTEGEPRAKRPRGERGGRKVAKQKELQERVRKGEQTPQVWWSKDTKVPEDPVVWEAPKDPSSSSGLGPSAPPGSPALSAGIERREVGRKGFLTQVIQPSLKPSQVRLSNAHTPPIETRILAVLDYNRTLNVSFAGQRVTEEGISRDVKETLVRWLGESEFHQLAVCSYIGVVGSKSRERRENLRLEVLELNRELARRGVSKEVGCLVVDEGLKKADPVTTSRAALFVDDRVDNCVAVAQAVSSCQVVLFTGSNYRLPQRCLQLGVCQRAGIRAALDLLADSIPISDSPPWKSIFAVPSERALAASERETPRVSVGA